MVDISDDEGSRREPHDTSDRHHRRRERKERVLHTRVSDDLARDIRRLARDLRVPASNLVRNVLEEVFTVVETVSQDVGELFEDVIDEAEDARDRIRWRAEQRRKRQGRKASAPRAEDIEEELRRDEVSEAAAQRARPAFPDVMGWQPLVLNQERECSDCGSTLAPAARAFVGVTETGLCGTTLCRPCMDARSS